MGASVVGVEEEGLVKSCGFRYFLDYAPKEISRLSELPGRIRSSLINHLRSRLGNEGFGRVIFDGGHLIDKQKLPRDLQGSQRAIPAYDLHFIFIMTEAPLVRYCAEIELDENGTVLHEIDLPTFAISPGKLRIATVAQVLEAAGRHGVATDTASVEAAYTAEFDNLEWLVSYRNPDRPEGVVTVLHLVAHDLEKYRWSEQVVKY